jgi:hypothetical protein
MQKDIFTQEQEQMIREAFDADDAELGIDKLNQVRALESVFNRGGQKLTEEIKVVEKKINNLSNAKKSDFYNWKTFTGSVLAAFSLGAVIANLTVTPVIIGGTRSIQLKQNVAESDRVASAVTLPDKASSTTTISGDKLRLPGSMPAWLQIVQLASSAAEEVIVEPVDKALRIRILLPKDRPDQALALKVALGLRPDVSGWITVNFLTP